MLTSNFGPGMAGHGEQIGRYMLLKSWAKAVLETVHLAERQVMALRDHPNVAHVIETAFVSSSYRA